MVATPIHVWSIERRLPAAVGTGYAALAVIKRFAIDELKTDRGFALDVDRGGMERALVAAIAAPARLLNVQVVAQGVQTPAQSGALRRLGCQIDQGHLFARHMFADSCEALLADMPLFQTILPTSTPCTPP